MVHTAACFFANGATNFWRHYALWIVPPFAIDHCVRPSVREKSKQFENAYYGEEVTSGLRSTQGPHLHLPPSFPTHGAHDHQSKLAIASQIAAKSAAL